MVTKLQINGKLKFYSKPYGRQWKWRYQNRGHLVECKLKIPKSFEGAKIIDPLHPETIPQVQREKWLPSVRHPLLEDLFPKLTIKDHPNYNVKPIKLFDRDVKLHQGVDQVCLLTKTKPVNGLPSSITDLANNFNDQHRDSLMKNVLRQALAFEPTKERIEGFKIPHDPKFNIRSEYRTPSSKQMSIILGNLIRLSNSALFKRNPNEILNRELHENAPQSIIFSRGDDLIEIRSVCDFTITSKTALKPIADEQTIQDTAQYNLKEMYPIFPTIDLKEEHVYDLNKPLVFGVNRNMSPNLIHTFVHLNNDNFQVEQDVSRLIMFAFGIAYAQSQLLKSEQKLTIDAEGRLARPIVVNGVSVSHQRFNFLTYQLNTLNMSNNGGVKNLAFYDCDNEIYLNRPNLKTLPYPSQKNVQRLILDKLEYNPNVLKKFSSLVSFV